MEEFEMLWKANEQDNLDPPKEQLEEPTPEYQIRDGLARYKLLCTFLSTFYFSKYGEGMPEFYFENPELSFRLDVSK